VTARFQVEKFRALAAGGSGIGHELHATDVTDSTNDDAFAAAAAGAPDGSVFVSDAQRAGRGRRGNTWLSVAGEGLLFSVLIKRRIVADGATLLPLATGLAVREAVARRLAASGVGVTPLLKWPNDVLADGRKLAGILVESRVRGQDEPVTVVGVGLNVGRLSQEISPIATSLLALGVADEDREALLFDILKELTRRFLDLMAEGGRERVVSDLNRLDALRGTRVSVGGVVGVASGIDTGGGLLITDERGVLHNLRSGHVETA
jgi:BirA family biotin operon repressor/biotin-[acetyl-CoA-carboxylase] ligase